MLPVLGHVWVPEQLPFTVPLLLPLLQVVPPELLLDAVHWVLQLATSQSPTAVDAEVHVEVCPAEHELSLQASKTPPGQMHDRKVLQAVSKVPICALQVFSTHEAQAELTRLSPCSMHEGPTPPLLLLLKPPLPLLKPPLLLPLLHESRLKPEHWLAQAEQLVSPEVAELQADEMLDAQACALHPLYEPPEHMQLTNGLHAFSNVLSDAPQLFWTHE